MWQGLHHNRYSLFSRRRKTACSVHSTFISCKYTIYNKESSRPRRLAKIIFKVSGDEELSTKGEVYLDRWDGSKYRWNNLRRRPERTAGPRTTTKGVHPEGEGLESEVIDGLLYPRGREQKRLTGLNTQAMVALDGRGDRRLRGIIRRDARAKDRGTRRLRD